MVSLKVLVFLEGVFQDCKLLKSRVLAFPVPFDCVLLHRFLVQIAIISSLLLLDRHRKQNRYQEMRRGANRSLREEWLPSPFFLPVICLTLIPAKLSRSGDVLPSSWYS